MCGRFANAIASNELVPQLQRHYPDLPLAGWADEAEQQHWRPRYNISPRSNVPVIRREAGQNVVRVMNWSVVPHWTKHETSFAERLKTINARSETITGAEDSSSLWMSLAPSKRCIVPVQGFYEWLAKGKGPAGKAPHYIRSPLPPPAARSPSSSSSPCRKDRDKLQSRAAPASEGQSGDVPPLMLAGLWDVCTYEEADTPVLTFTILTTSSSKRLRFLHSRMPCLLRSEAEMRAWLDCEPVPPSKAAAAAKEGRNRWTKDLGALLKPQDDVVCYAVPQEVGKVGNESPSFVHPVADRKDGIDSLFKQAFAKGAQPLAGPGPASTAAAARAKSSSPEKPFLSGGATAGKRIKGRERKGTNHGVQHEDEQAQVVLSDEDEEIVVLDAPQGRVEDSPVTVGSSPPPAPNKKSAASAKSSSGVIANRFKRPVDEEADAGGRKLKKGKERA